MYDFIINNSCSGTVSNTNAEL